MGTRHIRSSRVPGRLFLPVLLAVVPLTPALGQARLFDYMEDHTAVMLLVDPDTGIIRDANKSAVEFYGYPVDVLKGMNINRINALPPEEIRSELQKAAEQKRNYFVFPHRLAGGEIRTVEVYASPVFAPLYGKKLVLSIIHEITGKSVPEEEMDAYRVRLNSLVEQRARELFLSRSMNLVLFAVAVIACLTGVQLFFLVRGQRRAAKAAQAALEERTKLFAELQHRVKNSFATIASIIHIETSRTTDEGVRSALETLGGRVDTLSALYRLMYEGRGDDEIDLPEYLREITMCVSSAIGNPGMPPAFKSSVDSLLRDAKRASNLGLILNELVTNAYKHSPKDGYGPVRARFERTEGQLTLTVSNPGNPLPEGFSPGEGSGFGLLMVRELVRQLKGDLTFASAGGRVEFSVRVPD